MDSRQFREFGKAAVDYIADYVDTIRNRQVLPSVKPGYMRQMLPDRAPEDPELWKDFMEDFEKIVMPGMTHWISPQFHAYYPTANSYPGIVGEMLSAAMGIIGFDWISSPACTELEVEMMNWLGKLLGLPEEFLNRSQGPGGGIIQGSASESTFTALLAAKQKMVNKFKNDNPDIDEILLKNKFVAYTSRESNSSVEKAGLLGSMPMRLLQTDNSCSLRGSTLQKSVEEDLAKGLIPCFVVASLGTTGTCAFDRLDEIGLVCKKYGLWLHVDAAYAGASFVCPEYRYLMKGIELVDSFDFNPHKWMLVNSDCSAMWVKDSKYLVDAFKVSNSKINPGGMPNYTDWQIPMSRRFRSIKLWAVMRLYGATGIRSHIRKQISLAERFERFVLNDGRFEIMNEVTMGLVCFRIKGENNLTISLTDKLAERKNLFLLPYTFKDKSMIRFCVCSRLCDTSDIDFAWNEIKDQTDLVLKEQSTEQLTDKSKFDAANKFSISRKLQEKIK